MVGSGERCVLGFVLVNVEESDAFSGGISYGPTWQKQLLIWDASVFRQPRVGSRSCLLLE